jgi:hypothetical protein
MSDLVHRFSPSVHMLPRTSYRCQNVSVIYDLIDKRRCLWTLFEHRTSPPYSSLDETSPLLKSPPKSEDSIYAPHGVQPDDFRPIRLINQGVSGKVYLVEDKIIKKTFALKVIRKRSNNLSQIINEKDALCKVAGVPWFLSLEASMHDDKNFYLVTVCLQAPPIDDPFLSV